MRSLLIWVGVNRTTRCEKSVNKSVIMLEKLRHSRNAVFSTVELQTVHWVQCRWKWQRLAISRSSAEGKNKTLVKILGGHQHRTTPAGQILGGGRDPCNPAALTPMTVTDILVAFSLGQSVCNASHPEKMAERIELPFEVETPGAQEHSVRSESWSPMARGIEECCRVSHI